MLPRGGSRGRGTNILVAGGRGACTDSLVQGVVNNHLSIVSYCLFFPLDLCKELCKVINYTSIDNL